MLLRLEMPLIDPSLRSGNVVRWKVAEGERFEFGQDLCLVAVNEFAALRRTGRATLLSRRRRKSLKSDVEVREGKVELTVALTASEGGVLGRIVADLEARVTAGDLLAMVWTDASAEVAGADESAWVSAPSMRVVANVVDTDGYKIDREDMGSCH